MAPFFSDRRLKHDIKKIGEADNGLPIYTFKYKGDENQQTHVGFMADEVEKKNPDAVGLDPSGYKTVDYDKAAQSMGGAVKAFANGGVAGPYGSKVGQGVGVGSYVPQAYLPVGELMVADPSFAQQSQANFLDTLNSAATAGESVLKIRNLLRDPDAKQPTKETAAPAAAGNVQEFEPPRGNIQEFEQPEYPPGIGKGRAEGGGVKPQVHGDYMSTTLAAQAADKDKKDLMTSGQQSGQQGSAFGNIANTIGSVATIANALPMIFSSDRRLKHDIKRIGKTEKGLPIYTFKYKGDNREQTHIGFMADEVERNHPEAVGERNGYKTVDYSQAHKFATGGVAGRHGYALDGAVEDRIRDAMRKAAAAENDMRLTRDEVPAVQTLNDLPDARVVAAEAPSGYVGPNSRAEAIESYGKNTRNGDYMGAAADLAIARGYSNAQGLMPPRPTAVAAEAPTGVVAPRAPARKEYVVGNDVFTISPEGVVTDAYGNAVPAELAQTVQGEIDRQNTEYGSGLVAQSDEMKNLFEQSLSDRADRNRAANRAIAATPLTVDQRPKPRPVEGGVAAGAPGVEDESARFYRMAAANRFNAENAAATGVVPVSAPVDGQIRPKPRPLGLAGADVAADTVAAGVPVGAYEEMASTMREAGIANLAGDKLVPTGVAPADGQMRPKPRPEGLGAANISAPVIVGTTMTPAEGGSEFNLDRLAAAIRFQESGSPSGNYGAIGQPVSRANGTEDRAYGAYQIMGANIPSWTKEVLGRSMTPEEFLADPQAQETVAMAKLGEYYRKFGSAEDVASVWFSGRPLEGNNSYDATSKKSVPLYVSEVMAKYYGGGEGTPANYDIGTSPSGVTGISGGLRADTAGATSGGVKPYDERNTLGQMVYDRDGRVNRDAMLSLFAGLGDMLTSPSPFLLPSIGAGVAGAARTYMAREEQVADIQEKRLDALAKATKDVSIYNEKFGTNLTAEEYLRLALDINKPPPEGVARTGSPEDISFMGVPIDVYGENLNKLIDLGNGSFIRAADSLQYNEMLLAEQEYALSIGVINDPQAVANTAARISEIKAKNGVVPVLNADNSQKVDDNGKTVYTTDSTVSRIAQAKVEFDVGSQLKSTASEQIAKNIAATTAVNNMVDTFVAAGDRQGILAPIRELISGLSNEAGIGEGNFRALSNEIEKARSSFIDQYSRTSDTDFGRELVLNGLPALSKEAAANAYVLATMQAHFDREAAILDAISKASTPPEAYKANESVSTTFPMEETIDKYYKENLSRMDVADPTAEPENAPIGPAPQAFLDGLPGGSPNTQTDWEGLSEAQRRAFSNPSP